MIWQIILSRQATKDAKKIAQSGLKPQAKKLLELLEENPYKTPPPYEKLVGNLQGFYSRRISIQHRLVYQIIENEKAVHVLRMWTHYE
ncbi:MAG: Txe/YoeB family addiction module toxin [Methylococcales bacterium]|nr:Txe/YoeB family addiction module toxin [Methylococcales bacterium]